MRIGVKEARQRFSELVERASQGEEIVIIRRGEPVARMTHLEHKTRPSLPDLTEFRASLKVVGSLTEALLTDREEARY
jgi:prevent-host-death family protein